MTEPPHTRSRPWLHWTVFGAIFVAVYLLAGRTPELPLVGNEAPEVRLPVAAGGIDDGPSMISLSALRGEVVVLDFWASWCAACRRTSPILNDLKDEFAPEGVRFYAINVEAIDRQRLQAAHLGFGTDFPTLQDRGGTVQRMYEVKMLPTVVVVGRDGMVTWAKSGVPDESDLRDAIYEAKN